MRIPDRYPATDALEPFPPDVTRPLREFFWIDPAPVGPILVPLRAGQHAAAIHGGLVMIPLETLLALALLTHPTEAHQNPGSLQHLASTREAIQTIAVEWELLDPREVKFVLSRPEDFEGDIRLLQRRWTDLVDAPPLSDSLRFPDRAVVNDLLAFNRSYRQLIDQRQAMEPALWWEFQETLSEVDRLYQIWDLVRDARCDYYYVTVRRQALKKLRCLIGESAYIDGALPPHVPLWRFVRLD